MQRGNETISLFVHGAPIVTIFHASVCFIHVFIGRQLVTPDKAGATQFSMSSCLQLWGNNLSQTLSENWSGRLVERWWLWEAIAATMREKKGPTWNKTGKRNSKMNPGYGGLQGSGGEEPDPGLQRPPSPLRFWMSVSPHPVPPLAPLPQDSTSLFSTHPYRRCLNQQPKQLRASDYLFRTHYWSVCCMSVMISIPSNC